MNLSDLVDGTPAEKPWLNVVASSVEALEFASASVVTADLEYVSALVAATYVGPTAGAGAVPVPISAFPDGVAIIGAAATGSLTLPTSAAIDSKLGTFTDGRLISFTAINRNAAAEGTLIPPDAGPAQSVPRAPSVTAASTTVFFFTRIGGVWTCVNN